MSSKSNPVIVVTRARSLSSPQPSASVTSNLAKSSSSSSSSSKSKRASANQCLPRKNSTSSKRQSLPKSLSSSNISSTAVSSQQQQPQTIKVWLMNLLKIQSHPRQIKVLSAPAASSNSQGTIVPAVKSKPVDIETRSRAAAYLRLVESHKEFFKGCPEIDCHIVNMAFIYLNRATPAIAPEAFSTDLFFFALYLAWESEEDSTVGIEGLIHYVIGPFPSSRNKDKITRKYEIIEWKRKLNLFHTGKDKLWKALDYNTYAHHDAVAKIAKYFPADNEVFSRARKPAELSNYF